MVADGNLYESNLKNWLTLLLSRDPCWPTERTSSHSEQDGCKQTEQLTPLFTLIRCTTKLWQLFDYFINLQYACTLSYSRSFKSMCERLFRFYRMFFLFWTLVVYFPPHFGMFFHCMQSLNVSARLSKILGLGKTWAASNTSIEIWEAVGKRFGALLGQP